MHSVVKVRRRRAEPRRSAGPANVVGVTGGLGNQLFQYAFARWLERSSPYPSRLDMSSYRTRPDYLAFDRLPLRRLQRVRFADLAPHPHGRLAPVGRGLRVLAGPRLLREEDQRQRTPDATMLGRPAWWYGYWMYPDVVDAVIQDLRREVWAGGGAPLARDSVAVHIRRGDMVHHPSVLDAAYYHRAFARLVASNRLPSSTPVFVYSDDPEWSAAEVRLPNATYVTPGRAEVDLLELAQHRYLVLSGSTFSWWAARLLDRAAGSVVAPFPFSGVPGHRLDIEEWMHEPRSRADA